MAQIIYTISDEKLAEFKAGFLKINPVPLDEEGEPTMTEAEWIKEWGKLHFIKAYQDGKKKISREAAEIEEDLIL